MEGGVGRQIKLVKKKLQDEAGKPLLLKGRQILWLIYQHYRTTEAEGQMLDLQDLMAVRLQHDDARKFLNDWEMTLQGMREAPTESVLETFFKKEKKRRQL